jgi:hypothetical protein
MMVTPADLGEWGLALRDAGPLILFIVLAPLAWLAAWWLDRRADRKDD